MLSIIFFVLFILIWLMAIAFIIYAYFYHEQQRKVMRYIAVKLATLTEQNETKKVQPLKPASEPVSVTPAPKKTETKMMIDKNEPISKYESMTLPDEVDVSFK